LKTSAKKVLAIVSGALANKPFNGGNAWTRLSWVLGLRKLGCEVLFLEEIKSDACVDNTGAPCSFEASVNLSYFQETMSRFGLKQVSALLYDGGQQGWGISVADLVALAREARLLINISGHLTHPEIKPCISCKVYFDDDPGFTQFWNASGNAGPHLNNHDFYFTVGQNIGAPECSIPTGNLNWRHSRPPAVLDQWPFSPRSVFERFTTVASWRGSYGPVSYGGKTYGLKVHEFRKFLDLPHRTGRQFEIALQIHPGDNRDLDALYSHGWLISDPRKAAGSPSAFRGYVQHSSAEFSVAQGIYVDTNSGWFSDRTVRYLASGRPALVQDTGFSRNYPVGQGLLAFQTIDEATEGVGQITGDYARHCRAARRFAEEHFDSSKVICQLASQIGLELP
jgi:hypothetical protein